MAKNVEISAEAAASAEGLRAFVASHGAKDITISDVILRACNTIRQNFERIETKA